MSPEVPIRTHTSHDIGLVTALKLVAIFWAGTMPVVVPAWLIIKAEIIEQNRLQDDRIAMTYVTKREFQQTQADLVARSAEIREKLDAIAKNQQRVMIRLKVEP